MDGYLSSKEKAVELFNIFYSKIEDATAGLFEENVNYIDARNTAAKQCAIFAIEFAKQNPLNSDGYNKYLKLIKTEIINETH
jgi:hypothetical protein